MHNNFSPAKHLAAVITAATYSIQPLPLNFKFFCSEFVSALVGDASKNLMQISKMNWTEKTNLNA
jgi:hypothetical protein